MDKKGLDALLADVKFNSTRVDPSTYSVTLHDHTGLGGPMGSERTFEIEKWSFANYNLAMKFMKLLIERLATKDSRIDLKQIMNQIDGEAYRSIHHGSEYLIDFWSVGVSLGRDRGGIIMQSFSHDELSTQRVEVA